MTGPNSQPQDKDSAGSGLDVCVVNECTVAMYSQAPTDQGRDCMDSVSQERIKSDWILGSTTRNQRPLLWVSIPGLRRHIYLLV
jgi:hypothetical protein